MSTIDVIMPQMGESIAEGTLSKWLKQPGDAIKRDEPIFEISTDKVDAEIPSPSAGVLTEILVQEGETVAVQTVVARIDTEAAVGAIKSAAAPAESAKAPSPAAEPPDRPAAEPAEPKAESKPSPQATSASAPVASAEPPSRRAAEPAAPTPAAHENGNESMEERLRRRSTPLVRKMVEEHNLDLGSIPGSGLAGRVTKSDVLNYLESGAGAAEAPVRPAAEAPAAASRRPGAEPGSIAHPPVEPWEGDRVEPWSRIRKLTADHMIMSRRVSAHVNTIFEIDYTRIAGLRAQKKAEYAERGVNLTFLAFIAKAVADALRRHPVVNAAVTTESTIYRRDINLGIAVALDWGLIVPVIKHADELSLLGIARAINDLGERARGKKLSPDEVQRGTFTITNPGVFGSVIGTPIINQPQVAILCVGAIEKQPAVMTVNGADSIAIRSRGMVSLAFDHRIVDGSDADRFMADVKATLQEFPESSV